VSGGKKEKKERTKKKKSHKKIKEEAGFSLKKRAIKGGGVKKRVKNHGQGEKPSKQGGKRQFAQISV